MAVSLKRHDEILQRTRCSVRSCPGRNQTTKFSGLFVPDRSKRYRKCSPQQLVHVLFPGTTATIMGSLPDHRLTNDDCERSLEGMILPFAARHQSSVHYDEAGVSEM
jgi:hypothetical protein